MSNFMRMVKKAPSAKFKRSTIELKGKHICIFNRYCLLWSQCVKLCVENLTLNTTVLGGEDFWEVLRS